jgi:hypothetical protein
VKTEMLERQEALRSQTRERVSHKSCGASGLPTTSCDSRWSVSPRKPKSYRHESASSWPCD